MITNKNTGQKYIGQSKDIEDRWYNHIHSPKEYSYIDRAIKKYGVSIFDFTVIESVSISMLLKREQYWIKKYNTYEDKSHYNLTPGGDFNPMCVPEVRERAIKNMPDKHGVNNPMYGKKHTEETKELIRKKAIGRKPTQESVNKMKKTLSGRKKTEEHKKKISEAKKGVKRINYCGDKHPMFNEENNTVYYEIRKLKRTGTKQGFTFIYFENGKRQKQNVNFDKLVSWCVTNNKKLTKR